jgi:hypothetical protein
MAIEAIIRKLLAGEAPAPGARAATRALDLADYDRLFAARTIHTGFRDADTDGPLYARILGRAFDDLPPRVRALHAGQAARRWSGRAQVRRGRGPIAAALCALIGFPRAGDDVPVTVQFETAGDTETWTRNFGGKRFASTQSEGEGRNTHLLVETFGPIAVAMALVIRDGQLFLVPRRWSLFGVPLPKALMPGGTSFEAEIDGRFHFNVEIRVPLLGLIVAYQGWLAPDATQSATS